MQSTHLSLFHRVYDDTKQADSFHLFLKNIFNVVPYDALHALIFALTKEYQDDESIYRGIQSKLSSITPKLAPLTHALPSLKEQKYEIAKESKLILKQGNALEGYVEIGSTGRYVNPLKKLKIIKGKVILVNDRKPNYSPPDIVERGQLFPIGRWIDLNNYAPIAIEKSTVGLVSAYIGLHHMESEKLHPFLVSIYEMLRPGGYFIVRDHDVTTQEMDNFIALAHTVFGAVLGDSWNMNAKELRHFAPVSSWVQRIESVGFAWTKETVFQEGDPTDNALILFKKSENVT